MTVPHDTASVAERTRRSRPARRSWPCIFSAARAVFVLGEEALLFVRAGRRAAARRGSWRRHPGGGRDGDRIVTGGDDGKVVATDAKGETETHRDRSEASLDRSRRARPRRRGRLVGRQDRRSCAAPRARARIARSALDASAGWRSRRKASASRSRTTTAPRSGFRMRKAPRRKCSNGRARISASPSARTAGSWSLDAGADAARLAARRPQAHAHVGLCRAGAFDATGPPTASGSPPRARRSSSCGRSRARTGRWARAAHVGADGSARRGRRLSPAQDRSSRSATRRHGAARAHRGWRRNTGPEAGRRAGHGARLERGRPFSFLRHRRRRGRRTRSRRDRPETGYAMVGSASRASFLFEHDLFGKPDSTFPDHALKRGSCF